MIKCANFFTLRVRCIPPFKLEGFKYRHCAFSSKKWVEVQKPEFTVFEIVPKYILSKYSKRVGLKETDIIVYTQPSTQTTFLKYIAGAGI